MMRPDRRRFLKSAAVGLLGAGASLSPLRVLAAEASSQGAPVLVLVKLYGGNDGLNTVVPLAQYDRYRQLRPNIGFERDTLLSLGDAPDFAFNPGLNALHGLYGEGKVAVVNGVGLPPGTAGLLDHARSEAAFDTAAVGDASLPTGTGWAGRYLDGSGGGDLPPGVFMSGGPLPLTGRSHQPMAIDRVDDFAYYGWPDWDERWSALQALTATVRSGAAEAHRRMRQDAMAFSERIQAATGNYQPAVEYPWSGLANALREAAKLIVADMGIRVLVVGMGGFDTHADQANSWGAGYHENLLAELSEALSAFHRDLAAQGHGRRVLSLTVSEFGRRAYENSDWGTDHGYGSVALAVGDALTGGVYGEYPSLLEERLVLDGNLDVTVDFRSVYATVLGGFLGADPAPVLGGDFPQLGFV